jgi:radical SAM protein with 4Fe4S-binding SPASM domain
VDTHVLTALKAPISVNLEATLVCNLRCGPCFSNSATHRHVNPPVERVRRVIDGLAEAEVFEIRWFGGEFTTLNGWRELVAYAAHRNFFMGFVSNGTRITEEMARTLAASGITSGAMSLHGPEPVHDAMVGVPGAYQRTIRGLRHCRDAGIEINLLFTPTKTNFRSLREMARDLRRDGVPVDEIGVGRLCPSGEAIATWDQSRLTLNDYRWLFTEMRRVEEETGIHAAMGDAFPLCTIPFADWDLVTGCWQGTGFGHISFTGDVKSCSILNGSLGNILTTPLTTIWTEQLASMRTLEHLPWQCRICPHFCGAGCSASRPGAQHFAPDEFIPTPDEENAWTMMRRLGGMLQYRAHEWWGRARAPQRTGTETRIPGDSRLSVTRSYRMRSDINGPIGYFKGFGVLAFTTTSARALQLFDGTRSIDEVIACIRQEFPGNAVAEQEARELITTLHGCGLLA